MMLGSLTSKWREREQIERRIAFARVAFSLKHSVSLTIRPLKSRSASPSLPYLSNEHDRHSDYIRAT